MERPPIVGLERVAVGVTQSRPAITDHGAATRRRVPAHRLTWRRNAGPVLAGLVVAGLVLAGWPAVLGGVTTCADVQGHSMDDVVGVVKVHVPWVGHVLRVLRTPAFLATCFIGLILELVWPRRTRTRQRNGSGAGELGTRSSSTTAVPRLS